MSKPEAVDTCGVVRPKVLAVDDETVSRLVVSRMLGALGLDVSEASDVPEAIEMMQAESFDLVVSDYLMPSGTGLQLAGMAADRSIPFILLTGFSHEMELEGSSDEQVGVHLTKPVSSADLAKAVASCGVDAAMEEEEAAPESEAPILPALIAPNLALLDALGVEVTFVDSDARIMSSTAGARRALGYGQDFWRFANLFDLIHPEDVGSAEEALATLLSDPGESYQARFRARHADGHWDVVEVYGANLLDEPGIEAVVLTTRSVTIEEGLKTANEEAVRTAAAQGQYVASVSHELRSPLHGILGVAQLLEDQVAGEAAEFVRIIRTEAERLSRVIDDILDYAKTGSGALDVRPSPTSVRQVIEEVARICEPQTKPGVRLLTNVELRVAPWVMVDGNRLHQILLNLAANATRFTTTGAIEIVCRTSSDDRLYFAVSDTGVGIAPEEMKNLFEPFRQAQHSPTSGGTGLGLAISKNMINLMSGRLEVESTEGVGSTFSFAISAPKTEPRTAATADMPVDPIVADSAPRAMVIDDSHVNRLVIGRQLESIGFEVTTAPGGLEGLELLGAGDPFDVLVTDWHMPGMDGLDVIRHLRELESESGEHIPIVVMTASALAADRAMCLEAGADQFLAKPSTRDELFEVVRQYIPVAVSATPAKHQQEEPSQPQSPVSASAGSEEFFAPSVLDELDAQLGGGPAIVNVVNTYLGDLPGMASAIAVAVADADLETAIRSAHTLRSPSLMLGATGLGAFCRKIEAATDLAELGPTSTDELQRLSEQTTAGLTRWLDDRQEQQA